MPNNGTKNMVALTVFLKYHNYQFILFKFKNYQIFLDSAEFSDRNFCTRITTIASKNKTFN